MKIADWYYSNTGKLMVIPILLVIVSLFVVFNTLNTTGDIVLKDVSLTGGVSARVEAVADIDSLGAALESSLSQEVIVKKLTEFGSDEQIGFTVEAREINADQLESAIESHLGIELDDNNFSVEQTGSSLGESFYKQMVRAVIFAFIFMAIVVFITFRSIIPSVAVVFAAFFDLVVTIAAINLLGIELSTAGIAALLLLIGYSIDTDVLLTTRMIKREGETREKVFSSMKTGMTMTVTTVVALTVGAIVSNSDVIRQMFIIIILGLVFDVISTWIANVWILRKYLEKKHNG